MCVYYIYIYIYSYTCIYLSVASVGSGPSNSVFVPGIPGVAVQRAGVCENCTPFMRAPALQSSSRGSTPAPELLLFKLIVSRVFSSGGVFFSQTPVSMQPSRSRCWVLLER